MISKKHIVAIAAAILLASCEDSSKNVTSKYAPSEELSGCTIKIICSELVSGGYSIKGLVFGMGGSLLQAHNRDDYSFAMKCSYAIVDEEERFVQKTPSTAASKTARLACLWSYPLMGRYILFRLKTCMIILASIRTEIFLSSIVHIFQIAAEDTMKHLLIK